MRKARERKLTSVTQKSSCFSLPPSLSLLFLSLDSVFGEAAGGGRRRAKEHICVREKTRRLREKSGRGSRGGEEGDTWKGETLS